MWHVLNRFIAKTTRRNEYMAAQKTAQEARPQELRGFFPRNGTGWDWEWIHRVGNSFYWIERPWSCSLHG